MSQRKQLNSADGSRGRRGEGGERRSRKQKHENTGQIAGNGWGREIGGQIQECVSR
jgi:hypothetical protein